MNAQNVPNEGGQVFRLQSSVANGVLLGESEGESLGGLVNNQRRSTIVS